MTGPDRGPLTVLLDQCERIVQAHEHLRMDTDEDERVRVEVVTTARRALDACRDFLARTTPGDDRGRELADAALVADRVVALYRPSARLHPWHCYNTSTGEFIECRTDEQVAGYHRIPGTPRAPGPVAPAEVEDGKRVPLAALAGQLTRLIADDDEITCHHTAEKLRAIRSGIRAHRCGCPWHGAACDGTDHENHDPAMPLGERLATTPGVDRDRELAEIANAIESEAVERRAVLGVDSELARDLDTWADRLRALAAPAETEARRGWDWPSDPWSHFTGDYITEASKMGRFTDDDIDVLADLMASADEVRSGARDVTGPVATEAGAAASMLAEFHAALGQTFGDGGTSAEGRADMQQAETDELRAELLAGNHVGIARELADVVYLAYGTAFSHGIPLDTVIAEVHRANMTKQRGPDGLLATEPNGKVIKGAEFRPPDVASVLAATPQGQL